MNGNNRCMSKDSRKFAIIDRVIKEQRRGNCELFFIRFCAGTETSAHYAFAFEGYFLQ